MTEEQYLADLAKLGEEFLNDEITAREFCSIAKADFGYDDDMLIEELLERLNPDEIVKALANFFDGVVHHLPNVD